MSHDDIVDKFSKLLEEITSLGDVHYLIKLKERADVQAILHYCQNAITHEPYPAQIHYIESENHTPGYIQGHATRVYAELMFDCRIDAIKETTEDGSKQYKTWAATTAPKPLYEFKDQIEEVIIPRAEKH